MASRSALRILFVADLVRDPDSGAAGTEWQTLAALRRRGHRIDEIWGDGLPHRIRHWNLHYIFELPRAYEAAIAAAYRRQPYDVVHMNQTHCWLAAREHLRRGRPGVVVQRSHGWEPRAEEVIRHWLRVSGHQTRRGWHRIPGWGVDCRLAQHARWALRYAAGTIVSSALDRDYILSTSGTPGEKVACIAQAASPIFREAPPAPWQPNRLKRLLHVGGYSAAKDCATVSQAASTLLELDETATFTWVLPAADCAAALATLPPAVRLRAQAIPWMPQEELVRVYDEHGIFLFPSLFEGFGKVFLEAMARGLCVVGTPTGGMLDLIRPGENGALVPFHSPAAIVAAVRHWWANPAAAVRISAAAVATATAYSWDRVAAETELFYTQVLSQSADRRES